MRLKIKLKIKTILSIQVHRRGEATALRALTMQMTKRSLMRALTPFYCCCCFTPEVFSPRFFITHICTHEHIQNYLAKIVDFDDVIEIVGWTIFHIPLSPIIDKVHVQGYQSQDQHWRRCQRILINPWICLHSKYSMKSTQYSIVLSQLLTLILMEEPTVCVVK